MMKAATGLFLCLLIPFATDSVSAQTPQPPRDDVQSWNDLQLSLRLRDNIDLLINGTLRLGRHISDPVDERAGVGLLFKINDYLTISSGYLHVFTQPVPGVTRHENRFFLDGTVHFSFKGFVLYDRNMFERRLRQPVDATRYRNRLRIEHPVKFGRAEVVIFASDEVFYDWSVNRWVRNRFQVGAGKRFTKKFVAEIYYMRQNDGITRPGDLHIIGTVFKIKL